MAAEHTAIDRGALRRLRDEPLPIGTKGLPLGVDGLTIASIASAGWNLCSGQLPFPVLTLDQAALEHNIATMAEFCREHDVLLAPHGKTTMAPQIFERQIEAGCWAITAATPTQLSVYRAFGIGRIFYANQLVDRAALAWLAAELARDPSFEFFCLVDSVDGVAQMASALGRGAAGRTVSVLVEVGHPGGRTGCRSAAQALAVAQAVKETPSLRLAGIEAFEGTLPDEAAAGRFLEQFTSVVEVLSRAGVLESDRAPLVSAGGSAFLDSVLEMFATLELPGVRRLVRSGAYVTHDGGFYEDRSPLGARAGTEGLRLRPALELWAVVQSRPEPGLVIVGAGKRDLPIDLGPPELVRTWSEKQGFSRYGRGTSTMLGISDQHLHLGVPVTMALEVGDLVACSISHPCTAFDKWRIVPLVTDDLTVVDAIRTFF